MRPFQKLTPSEIAHLHQLIANLLETSISAPPLNPPQDNYSIRELMAEIGDNKAVTAELATMTCSILEELAICQQDNRDLKEELEVAHGRDKLASIELGELRQKLEQLAHENGELALAVQSYRNERDIYIFKYELAASNHEKQKQELLSQLHHLELQMQRISHNKLAEDQKISSLHLQISQLHQSNTRLQEQIVTMKTLKIDPLPQTNKALLEDEADESMMVTQSQHDTSIKDTTMKLQGSSLKYQLLEPIEIGQGWNLQTARYNTEYRQANSQTLRQLPRQPVETKYKPINIEELSDKDSNKDKSEYGQNSYSEIYNQSREDLSEKNNLKFPNPVQKLKNASNLPSKVSKDLKNPIKAQAEQQSQTEKIPTVKKQQDGGGFEKKPKPAEGKVSRIKYLLQALGGGDNSYKRQKTQRYRAERSETETGEAQKKRLILKRLVSNPTSCTMTPVPSVNFLKKETQA